ncbi:hypothetical protein E3P92_01789 [Wallemia ichthyophaga]|nr:hypothetical protein E3P95_02048 [Wallemia ichthyophaga]TIB00593.1 hypothetical protein E3P94_02172 [Wallemia ichthyophaga]TIB15143.1 hypothetical protein E3P92_01789 [Wallemia ichthyophaga]TIB35852.1 hypothetical protein E3P84_01223 [Wallemia ichthyophaga]TIB42458.1 hypothetical protein E3P83_01259 [Wallemia ichthyophaga]
MASWFTATTHTAAMDQNQNFKVGSPNVFIEAAKDALWSLQAWLTQCMSSRTKTININGTQYNIIKYLSEGAFSYVYLVSDADNVYALKKITNGGFEGEVGCYQRFKSKYIISLLNYSIQDGAINLILPYLKKGNLQDYINLNSTLDERMSLQLFSGVCQGVQVLHNHYPAHSHSRSSYPPSSIDQDVNDEEGDQPGHVPYAHRDIKPGNVMLADDGTPVLMDLGSCIKARVRIHNRSQALVQQDMAAEHSSMPYRAPELFDVKSDTTLDEKVDIWSLGCTLYALAYSHSPFEDPKQAAQGGSIAMAAQSGRFTYPANDTHSDTFKAIIEACLKIDPSKRPTINQLISMTEHALSVGV